jgi:hypothetical protein
MFTYREVVPVFNSKSNAKADEDAIEGFLNYLFQIAANERTA